MGKELWTHLTLPLVGLFGVAIFMHTRWEADGFFLNLATELVGILITIGYVDWILRHHEKQRWFSADARIANRLRILLNATISGIRNGLGFGPEVLDQEVMTTSDPIVMHKEIIRVAEHVIAPTAQQRVRALDQNGWKSLATQVQHAHNGVMTFLNMFQSRLNPEQITYLLDLQEALANSLTFYTTFPDLAGVPKEQLPRTKTPPEQLQQFGCKSTANELRQIMILVKKISETVGG